MLVDFLELVLEPLPVSLLLPLVLVDCDVPVVDAEPVDSAVRDPVEVPVDPDTAVDSGKSRAVKSERVLHASDRQLPYLHLLQTVRQ